MNRQCKSNVIINDDIVSPRLSNGTRLAVRVFGAGRVALLAAVPFAAASATPYRCTPSVQYACTVERCDRTTEGFQHAESFSYDPKRRRLGACLWTSCYEGGGQVFDGGPGSSRTVVGSLTADNPAVTNPLVLSLTIDAQDRFVAVWQYDGAGLSFDQGRCTQAGSSAAETGKPPR